MPKRARSDNEEPPVQDYTFPVGTVFGFHGLAGEVKVKPTTNNPELLSELETVEIEYAPGAKLPENAPSILKVTSIRIDRRVVFMKFAGLADRTSVEHLNGARLTARES